MLVVGHEVADDLDAATPALAERGDVAAQHVEVADPAVVRHQVDPRLEDRLAPAVGGHDRLHRVDDLGAGQAERVDVGPGQEPQPDLARAISASLSNGTTSAAQQVREPALVVGVEPGEQRALPRQQALQGAVDGAAAGAGQPDQHAAPVARVGQPLDEPARGQPVDAVGHRAAGHEGLLEQPARGELVRRPRAAQGREHVELPGLDVVLGEDLPAGPVEVVAQPGDPAQHLHRLQVEVGALPLPGLDEPVDLVAHAADMGRRES